MPKVFQIGVTDINNKKINIVDEIEIVSGKGIKGDRYFHDYNDVRCQITLIEKENIDYYNKKKGTSIPYIDFRRNIITSGIELNDLIGKQIKIGNTTIIGRDLCRPCRSLEKKLGLDDFVKEFLRRGGLRCEILQSGKIQINQTIEIVK